MTEPCLERLMATVDATWPPARVVRLPGWQIRDGAGGGQRVSSATATTTAPDISAMEAAHANLGQEALVMVRPGEEKLDTALAAAGYRVRSPVTVWLAPVAAIASDPPPVSTFLVSWPPLNMQAELWADGGIGPERLAVMDRAEGRKCTVLGRSNDQPAGTAFIAVFEDIAMLHALEVSSRHRRSGTARNMMRAAALWAGDMGARWLAVLVTRDNTPANRLYSSLGMSQVGGYHYRVK